MLVVFSKVSSAETFIINPDDSIQNTINSANAGDIILLNSGTYNITGISVNKALTIAGKPYFDTNDKIKISEVIFDATGDSGSQNFVIQESSGKVVISGIKFIGGDHTLVCFGEIEVAHCVFEGGVDLFSFEAYGYGEIHDCEFRDSADDAIDIDSKALTSEAFISIHDNLIEDTGDDGIEIRFYVRGNSQPILVYDIHDNLIRGAGKNRGDGIQLIDQDNLENSRVLNIYRNIIDGQGLTEVGIGCLDNGLSDEDFKGTDGMNEPVYIYNNTILDTTEFGIIGGDHTFVINNIIVNSKLGIKHVSKDGVVDYTLTYLTANGATIDVIDGGNNYFDHDPGLDMDTYKLKDDSFSLGKGIDTFIDHNSSTTIFTISNYYGNAPSIGAVDPLLGTEIDNCPLDPDKTEPGICGCGVADNDIEPDGMVDCWEIAHGLDPTTNDATDDLDGDGFKNIIEYNRGTDPQDPRSYPSRAMPWVTLLLDY